MKINKNGEQLHYIIACFCSMLLFFFVGAWYLAIKKTTLHISANIWAVALLLYGIINTSYYLYNKTFPYIGELRFLVFADVFFIALCTLIGFPPLVVLILINTQIILLVFSVYKEKHASNLFFYSYFLLLMALCLLLSESQPQKIITFFVLFCGESIFILSFWYGLDMFLGNYGTVWSKKIQQIQENHVAENYHMKHKIREEEKALCTLKKMHEKQEKSLASCQAFLSLLSDPMQFKIWQKLANNKTNSLEKMIALKNKKQIKSIAIEEFIQQAFQYITSSEKLLIVNKTDNFPSQIDLYEPSWIIYQWLLHLIKQDAENFSIELSTSKENISLKGILKANIVPASSTETTCLECKKNVRSLYEYNEKKGCLQCCRKILESNLAAEDSISLSLIKKIMHHYQLGNIQCGISSWDNREYFISIVLKRIKGINS